VERVTDWLHVFLFVCINLKNKHPPEGAEGEEKGNAMAGQGLKYDVDIVMYIDCIDTMG
jgi:hypothetical protein